MNGRPSEDRGSHLPMLAFLFSLIRKDSGRQLPPPPALTPVGKKQPINNQITNTQPKRERETKIQNKNQRSEQTESDYSAGHFPTPWRHALPTAQ